MSSICYVVGPKGHVRDFGGWVGSPARRRLCHVQISNKAFAIE